VNAIDDACNKRYSEEYSKGEYCHEQSFKWGFQEGVDWLEKQNEQKTIDDEELSRLATTKAYDAYPISKTNMYNNEWNAKRVGYYQGYEQALKDNKFKKTIDWGEFDNDMITSINCLTKQGRHLEEEHLNWINSLKSKTYQEWSNEDENAIKTCIYAINYTFKDDDNPHKLGMEDWLKSLKNRVQPQQQVWSKDDEKIINDAIWLIEHYATDGHKKLLREQTIDKLKSLKPQQKQEWTEEDERMLNLFLHKLEVCNLLSNNENTWIINKLKSINKTNGYPQKNEYNNNCKEDIEPKFMVGDTIRLKNFEAEYTITNIHDRCYFGKGWSLDIEETDASEDWELVNPKQSCWKPTEEQMNAFRKLLDYNIGVFEYKSYMIVETLYEDLQKNTEK
jgi:ribosome assembly protein YihI (activator of Der GTPase)